MFENIDPTIASDDVVPPNDCGGSSSRAISMQIWRCDPTAQASFHHHYCEVVLDQTTERILLCIMCTTCVHEYHHLVFVSKEVDNLSYLISSP